MYGTLNNEQQLLLLACRTTLSSDRIQQLNEIIPNITDWENVAEMIRLNGVSAIFFHSISKAGLKNHIPEPVRSVLQQSYYANITRNTWVELELLRILTYLKNIDIPVIPLKGILLGKFVFGDTALRQSNDIDLLVDRKHGQYVWDSMKTQGYLRTGVAHDHWHEEHWEDYAKHFPALNNGKINLEIHQSLFPSCPELENIMNDVWKRTRKDTISGIEVHTLSLEHQLLFLSYHLDTHVDVGQFQLRLYLDLAEILTKFGTEIDWTYLLTLGKQSQLLDKLLINLHLISVFYEINLHLQVETAIAGLKSDLKLLEKRFSQQLLTGKTEDTSEYVFKSLYSKVVKMKGTSTRVKFITGRFFPTKEFMIQRYQPRYPSLYFFYYIRRILDGFLRMLESLRVKD